MEDSTGRGLWLDSRFCCADRQQKAGPRARYLIRLSDLEWSVEQARCSLVIEVSNDIELSGLVLVRETASVLESLHDVTRRSMNLFAVHPASRYARLLLRRAFCREQETCRCLTWPILCTSLTCRTLLISFVVVGGCRPQTPAYCCARLLLLRVCCREQETCQYLTLLIVCALHLPGTHC